MATVCSGTMALMDAGVKIKKPVSGIAMGLISDGKRYSVLSDILGDEDHLGDMDFKVTGGKIIQEMQKETGTTIVIEEEDEKGVIEILGTNQEMIDLVIEKIDNITFKPEVGKEYNVKVVKILEFGAVVEFRPGKEVLLHISEIAWERVEKVEKYLNIGDITKVKYMGIDSRTRKQKVSRKILLERPKKKD